MLNPCRFEGDSTGGGWLWRKCSLEHVFRINVSRVLANCGRLVRLPYLMTDILPAADTRLWPFQLVLFFPAGDS